MIDAARALRDQAQERLDAIAAEAEGLQSVIEALSAFIEQPAATAGDGAAPAAQGEPGAARDSVGSPTSQPAARQGRTRSSSSSAPRSAAASSPPGGGSPATPLLVKCPECGEEVRSRGLGVHRAKSKRHAEAIAGKATGKPQPLGADVVRDRREIDEVCPRGCGRRFRWEPSLLSHARSCDGTPGQRRTPPPARASHPCR